MGKLLVYNFVSANGYFKGPNEDISWAHQSPSQEESDFAAENAQGGAVLLFGRKTYEMISSYWPTPEAKKNNAGVAEGMNKAEKIVFSKTLAKVEWNNTRLIKDNIAEEVSKLKQQPGKDLVIFGSPSLAQTLMQLGLIDDYRLTVNPVVLGSGKPLFKDLKDKINLKLLETKTFNSGVIGLHYETQRN